MAEVGKQPDKYPDAHKIITIVVMVYLFVYVVSAWNPEIIYFFFDTGGKGTQDGGKFGLLGTIGDFLGGVINPILTFITIYLLLVSIRIQREELEETRTEMKAATVQAERAANAASHSILITQIGMRPFLKFYIEQNPEVVFYKKVSNKEGVILCDIKLCISNIGKSSAVIKEVLVEYFSGADNEKRKLISLASVPIGFNEKERITFETEFSNEDWFSSINSASLLYASNINIVIKYKDAFEIGYVFSYELKPKDGHTNNETTIVFSAVSPSFKDRVEYQKFHGESNEGGKGQ